MISDDDIAADKMQKVRSLTDSIQRARKDLEAVGSHANALRLQVLQKQRAELMKTYH